MEKNPPPAKQWLLYVLRCNDNTLYCGITNNLPGRIEAHNRGKGARYTKGRGRVVLIKSWPAASMSAALKAERAFKAMTRGRRKRESEADHAGMPSHCCCGGDDAPWRVSKVMPFAPPSSIGLLRWMGGQIGQLLFQLRLFCGVGRQRIGVERREEFVPDEIQLCLHLAGLGGNGDDRVQFG